MAGRIIDLDGTVSPQILASLLGLNVNSLYKFKNEGRVSDWTEGKNSYAECVTSYINNLEKQARGNVGSLGELKIEKEIQLTVVRSESMLLDMKIKKQEFGSYEEIKELIEPIFHVIAAGLNNITRKFSTNKELIVTVDNLLATLSKLGSAIEEKANLDGDRFVKEKMDASYSVKDITEVLKDKFNINESLEF